MVKMFLPDALKALTYVKEEYDKYGFKKLESYRERRSTLRELIAKAPKIRGLGLIDRLGTRG